jgi:hypothetical protein
LNHTRVEYGDDSSFLGNTFRRPAEISRVESQGSEFAVSTTNTDFVDTFCADTGVCWLSTEFELSFFAVGGTLCTGGSTLMAGVARDTHPEEQLVLRIAKSGRNEGVGGFEVPCGAKSWLLAVWLILMVLKMA